MSKWTYVYLDGVEITCLDSNEEREAFNVKLDNLTPSMLKRVMLVNDWEGDSHPSENGFAHSDSHDVIYKLLIEKDTSINKEDVKVSPDDFFATMQAAFSKF